MDINGGLLVVSIRISALDSTLDLDLDTYFTLPTVSCIQV